MTTRKKDDSQFDEDGKPVAQPDGVNSKDELTPDAQRLQDAEDEAVAKGFRGVEVDTTDDHAYTVAGQLAGEPTPETHPEQAAKVGSLKFR
jgi:hypothetical protein